MTLTVGTAIGQRRFDALLSGQGEKTFDRTLLERSGWIVAPTLGAIVPNWLLAIPRQSVLSMRDWTAQTGERPESVTQDLLRHLGLSSREIIWFEHGPSVGGSSVGCGLDHAHLHILIRPRFEFSAFAAKAREMSDLDWHESKAGYAALESDASYFIAGCDDAVIGASHVERVGSQFFRRVVGALAGQCADWDYRHHPYEANIAETVETFRTLESAAARG